MDIMGEGMNPDEEERGGETGTDFGLLGAAE